MDPRPFSPLALELTMSREKCLRIIRRRYPDLNVKVAHIEWLRSTAKWIINNPNK
jgi:hypothetical protein